MNKPFAFVFPGQGSQQLGMLNDLAEQYPLINDTFNEASDILGYDLWQLTQLGPQEKLNQTEYTQPALLTAGVAVWRIWQQQKAPTPKFLAGHSLGEYTALVCANSLDFATGIKLVAQRGQFMQQAVPLGYGGMAAIIGLSNEKILEICHLASSENQTVSPANYNSIGQVVVAGQMDAIDRAVLLAKENSAKLVKKLPMSIPSHCPLMKSAALQLAETLKSIGLKTPIIPVIQNADVQWYANPDQIKDALIRQLESPVRWVETVQYMARQGVLIFLESAPGKVLTGLNKRIIDNPIAIAMSQPDCFQEAFKYIGA